MVNDEKHINEVLDRLNKVSDEEIIAAAKKVDLEESIQIVKRFLEECDKDLDGEISLKCDGFTREAIEEVLRAHNELQEEFFWQQIRIRNDYVPISMVKDKIDEYRKRRIELSSDNYWVDERYINNDTALVIGMSVLQELLEERNK